MTALRAVRTSPDRSTAALAERVLAGVDELLARLADAYRAEIPEYAAVTDEQMATEVLPVSRRLVEVFLDHVVREHRLSAREMAVFEDSGRRRMQMGIPLESVLHAYRIAGREAWSAVCAAVEPGSEAVLADLGARWIDLVDRTSSALAQAYISESHERLRDLDARRRELVEALLSADGPSEVAAVGLRFSVVLAAAYVPVVVAGAGAAAGIDSLLAEGPPGTIGGHRGDRVLLLVPHRLDKPLARTGVLVAWGRPAACGIALCDELTHVENLLTAAVGQGRTEGAFGPDELLVEQLLLGNDRVTEALRRRVADRLESRDPSGAVAATLRSYLATGSVPATARREHVHPNTVGYRLGRARELTGLDARIPQEAVLLVLGLGLTR